MSYKVERIGRSAAVISSLILSALLLNLWVLNADAEERKEQIPVSQFSAHQFMPVEQDWFDQALELFTMKASRGASLAAADSGLDLDAINRNGKPFAYVHINELFVIDKRGRIIASADSCSHYNLPIITGSTFLVDEKQKMLVDDGSQNAIELLRHINKQKDLEPLLSEIKISDNGIIAYFGFSKVIPVIFGEGGWQQKINNLIAYQTQLGGSDLAEIAAYLDLRIEDRIIVKKNV